MPTPIQVMDPHLAAKIAAGEVIERPASVVKELVENSLDAGANHVRVELHDGGAERILVADDGYGIASDQVELAFRRHATSKLREETDLNALATLGFRGEALPSIVAVADGDLRNTAIAILGSDAAEHLLNIPNTSLDNLGATIAEVDGVCASGSYHRAGRSGVTVLINRRPVTNRTLTYAVTEAYGSLLPTGRQPVAIVSVRVPPDEVDFNVHPSKLEVKLLRERAVYAAIQRALRSALASAEWSIPSFGESDDAPSLGEALRELRVLGQAGKTYLIAEGELGVYLVDQHAAHERVLLEDLRRSLAGRSEQQLLLEPLVLDVPPAAVALAEQASAELIALGFAIEPFGPRQVLVRGVPGVLTDRQPQRVLQETLVTLATNTHGLVIEQHASWSERLAIVLACKSAVRAGDTLAQPEMESLLRRLGEATLCRTCAHGRPTAILLSHAQLEKEFGRR